MIADPPVADDIAVPRPDPQRMGGEGAQGIQIALQPDLQVAPDAALPEECLTPRGSAGAIAGAVSAMLRSDLSRYACESCRTALAYQGPVLDARRNAFFDRIRREVASASGGECS